MENVRIFFAIYLLFSLFTISGGMLYCHGEKDSLLHNDQTNKTYFLVYSPLNWTSAFDYCRNNYNGGYFSWIRKPADRDYVLNMLPKEVANSSKDVWIGYVLLHSNLLKVTNQIVKIAVDTDHHHLVAKNVSETLPFLCESSSSTINMSSLNNRACVSYTTAFTKTAYSTMLDGKSETLDRTLHTTHNEYRTTVGNTGSANLSVDVTRLNSSFTRDKEYTTISSNTLMHSTKGQFITAVSSKNTSLNNVLFTTFLSRTLTSRSEASTSIFNESSSIATILKLQTSTSSAEPSTFNSSHSSQQTMSQTIIFLSSINPTTPTLKYSTNKSQHTTPVSSTSSRPSKPATVTSKSATVTSKPETLTSKSATVVSKPATVTYQPATVTSKPAIVTSKPATVTSKPTTVTSKPATVTSKPSTDTLHTAAALSTTTSTLELQPTATYTHMKTSLLHVGSTALVFRNRSSTAQITPFVSSHSTKSQEPTTSSFSNSLSMPYHGTLQMRHPTTVDSSLSSSTNMPTTPKSHNMSTPVILSIVSSISNPSTFSLISKTFQTLQSSDVKETTRRGDQQASSLSSSRSYPPYLVNTRKEDNPSSQNTVQKTVTFFPTSVMTREENFTTADHTTEITMLPKNSTQKNVKVLFLASATGCTVLVVLVIMCVMIFVRRKHKRKIQKNSETHGHELICYSNPLSIPRVKLGHPNLYSPMGNLRRDRHTTDEKISRVDNLILINMHGHGEVNKFHINLNRGNSRSDVMIPEPEPDYEYIDEL